MTNYIERDLASIIQLNDDDRVVVIVGSPCVGKTTLINHLVGNTPHCNIQLEHQNLGSCLPDVSLQNLPSDHTLIVEQKDPAHTFALACLIKKQLSHRILITSTTTPSWSGGLPPAAAPTVYHLWPLSLAEQAAKSSWSAVIRSLPQRLIYGSYPFIGPDSALNREQLRALIHDKILNALLLNACQPKKQTLLTLLRVLARNIGQELIEDNLAKDVGISVVTLKKYLQQLEHHLVIVRITAFHQKLKAEVRTPLKFYFCDNGIRNALLDRWQGDELMQDLPALWQNLFVMERIKYHDIAQDGARIYFWRTSQTRTVDFMEVAGQHQQAFQCVCFPACASREKFPRTFTNAYPECLTRIARVEDCATLFS